jgi:uncharacterized protein YecT (DUF1311 family)
MRNPSLAACAVLILGNVCSAAIAQQRQPTAQEIAAIRDCFAKHGEDVAVETNCLYKLVAEPCIDKEGGSTHGMADCHRIETEIWDRILNEQYKSLQEGLDQEQRARLREMQRAWIASRDKTCEYYHHQIRGSMAIPMSAACMASETSRRAALLRTFGSL